MRLRIVGQALLVIASVTCCSAQKAHPRSKASTSGPNFYVVDRVLPPFCGMHIVAVATTSGSDAYLRLNAISEALATAQDGAANLKNFSDSVKDGKAATDFMSDLFEAEQKTVDGLHCAAQVMNAYKQKENSRDELISLTLVAAFNQEAYAIQNLGKSQKVRFSRRNQPTPAERVVDSEKLQAMQDSQRDAGSSILEASGLATSLSADTSGPADAIIEFSQLTCVESARLMELLKPVADKTETIYGQSADLVLQGMKKLKCRP